MEHLGKIRRNKFLKMIKEHDFLNNEEYEGLTPDDVITIVEEWEDTNKKIRSNKRYSLEELRAIFGKQNVKAEPYEYCYLIRRKHIAVYYDYNMFKGDGTLLETEFGVFFEKGNDFIDAYFELDCLQLLMHF